MRYAIYFAPPAGSPLWQAGAHWLGRDAATGAYVPQPFIAGVAPARFAALTDAPRRYGFHATLKPPFMLAAGAGEADLECAMARVAAGLAPVPLAGLAVGTLDGFIALRPVRDAPALQALAAVCVTELDHLRAPPDSAERARRDGGRLSARERALFECWGYPWVMELWRFHMTLTDRVEGDERTLLLQAARAHFSAALAAPWRVEAIDLFVEDAPGAPFRRTARFELPV
ncbi:MAG: DUF1045 domain-containing protein [Alphaproteobacteria bacterium]